VEPTIPGTDMKVTPEIVVPIIEMATTYHGDFRSPEKKALLLSESFLVVNQLTVKIIAK
jgi:hypothetical protein